jgi:hypothetical protein
VDDYSIYILLHFNVSIHHGSASLEVLARLGCLPGVADATLLILPPAVMLTLAYQPCSPALGTQNRWLPVVSMTAVRPWARILRSYRSVS